MRILCLLLLFIFTSCQTNTDNTDIITAVKKAEMQRPKGNIQTVFSNTGDQLDAYWHQGLGEINVYSLEQNRYKDTYNGGVVLIFVTEDFLTDKQVKNDAYKNKKSTPILKTNAIQRFSTGIYDYSLMTSVFTPVQTSEWPATMKVTNSGQDWCGQVYSQINWNNEGEYQHLLHSYFENEGDQENTSEADLLEDEIMNRIRMGWQHLPEGEKQLIPSMNFLRLLHQPYASYTANLSVSDYSGDDITSDKPLKVYTIQYPALERTLEIIFQAKAPFIIEGWKDAYPSIFDKKIRSSIAVRQKTVLEDYWSHHSPSDHNLRDDLGL